MGLRGQAHVSGPEVPWPDRMSPPRSPHLTMQSQSKRQSLPVPGPLSSWERVHGWGSQKGDEQGRGLLCGICFF